MMAFFIYLFSSLSFKSHSSHLTLSLYRSDGGSRVAIQSQACGSNHLLLIGFIILSEDLRWRGVSWPSSAALMAVILAPPPPTTPAYISRHAHACTPHRSLCFQQYHTSDSVVFFLFYPQKFSKCVFTNAYVWLCGWWLWLHIEKSRFYR